MFSISQWEIIVILLTVLVPGTLLYLVVRHFARRK